jgi:hypothetical protein
MTMTRSQSASMSWRSWVVSTRVVPPHHQPVETGDPPGELVGGQAGLHHAGVPAGLEVDDGLLGHAVGEE